ncbi:carboxy-S-adenosyl-L-methionine synthase CmoA [Spirochaetota bacterium]
MSKKDDIYEKRMDKVAPFSFSREVADAFDDMAQRSIPLYMDMQRVIARFSLEYYKKGSLIYDLGCSTGNTAIEIFKEFNKADIGAPEIISIDKSIHMIEIAKGKYFQQNVKWICDSAENVSFENASVVIGSFILQFLDHSEKKEIIKRVSHGLMDGGIFILCEKVISEDKTIDSISRELYHAFKMNTGYSQLEIEQKERALENVLKPFTLEKYNDFLKQAGFNKIDVVLKYLNFMCLVAVK